jgi:hypothetical protein
MARSSLNTLPLPCAEFGDPDKVLETYRQVGSLALPGMVVHDGTLDGLAALLEDEGLVTPGYAFNNTSRKQHEYDESAVGPMEDIAPHVDHVPDADALTVLQHHLTTRGSARLTFATLADAYLAKIAVEPHRTKVAVQRALQATLARGRFNADILRPEIYRGEVGIGDIAVLRLTVPSPTVHHFGSVIRPRGAIMRGYDWQGTTAP